MTNDRPSKLFPDSLLKSFFFVHNQLTLKFEIIIIIDEGIKMSSTIVVIIFVVALILSVGFLMLVLSLVPTINQLKSLLKDLEKTSAEARDLALQLKSVSGKVDKDIEKFDQILDSTKETVGTVKESFKFLNKNILKQTAGVLGLVSAIRLGWNFVKKLKRR